MSTVRSSSGPTTTGTSYPVVVVRTVDGRITGLSAKDGANLWVHDHNVPVLTLRGVGEPVVIDGQVIAGFASGKLIALRLNDGALLWEARVAIPGGRSDLDRVVDIDATLAVGDGVVHVTSYQGNIATVLLRDGRVLWNRDMSSHTGIAADRRNLYVSDDNSHVWALERRSGASLWKQDKLQARAVTAPVVFGNYLVVGDIEGYLHWMSRSDGSFVARVRIDEQGILAPPVRVGDILYVSGKGGTLTALRPGA